MPRKAPEARRNDFKVNGMVRLYNDESYFSALFAIITDTDGLEFGYIVEESLDMAKFDNFVVALNSHMKYHEHR